MFILEDITKVLPTYQWLQQWLLHPNGGVRWNCPCGGVTENLVLPEQKHRKVAKTVNPPSLIKGETYIRNKDKEKKKQGSKLCITFTYPKFNIPPFHTQ